MFKAVQFQQALFLSDILQILNIILLTVKQFKDSVFGVAAELMQPGIQTLDEHEESLFTQLSHHFWGPLW